MPELKVHDPSVVLIQRRSGEKGYWRIHKDGTEEFVEDKLMTNPREDIDSYIRKTRNKDKKEYAKKYYDWKMSRDKGEFPRSDKISPLAEQAVFVHINKLLETSTNPRKKERELRKPERPGNYQKIMKEIDDKGATEYKFRMMPPGKFDEQSFRRKVITTGVSIVVGCPKGEFSHLFNKCKNGMAVQALRLAKSVFKTKKDAAKWVAAHTMTKY